MKRHDLERAYYCATEVLNTRRLRGKPIPNWLKRYHDELDAAWYAMSLRGRETSSAAGQSSTIGADEAAALLGVSPRHVRRVADKLGGQRVSGTWVFSRSDVEAARKGSP